MWVRALPPASTEETPDAEPSPLDRHRAGTSRDAVRRPRPEPFLLGGRDPRAAAASIGVLVNLHDRIGGKTRHRRRQAEAAEKYPEKVSHHVLLHRVDVANLPARCGAVCAWRGRRSSR